MNDNRIFDVRSGAKQGGTLNTTLFNIILDELFKKWKDEESKEEVDITSDAVTEQMTTAFSTEYVTLQ